LTFNYPTVAAVTEYLAGRVRALNEAASEPVAVQPVIEAAAAVVTESATDDDSSEDLAAMLEERLARLGLGGVS
jgi:hypothetical protein